MAISKRIKKVVAGDPKVINTDMGTLGDPINKSHPFYFGFIATIGALTAFVLMRALASASQIFVLILIALFLATGLNPAVKHFAEGVCREQMLLQQYLFQLFYL